MSRPGICIAGPLLGSVPGWVVSQGEILAACLDADGFDVVATSGMVNRYLRPADIASSLMRWRTRIDVVIALMFSGPAFAVTDLTSLVAKGLNKRLILHLHGGNLPDFARAHRRWVARVLDRADAIVAPSSYLAQWADRTTRSPVHTIPNIVPLDGCPFEQRHALRPHVLWMRTFQEIYRPELAVEALARLRSSVPGIRLTMAGQDRGRLAPVRRLVAGHGLAEHVHFAGFLDASDKRRQFAANDIFLNTAAIDNMPVTLLEAAAFGLPIVSTSVGGIPHVFTDGRDALLVDGDAGDLARAIRRLLKDPSLARQLSSSGRRLAESCSWEAVGGSWRELCNRIVTHA